jgi:predicted component of type VI protein secretion system
LQIKAALHKDTVSGGAVRTLLGRNVVLGTTVPEDSERGDELLDDEIKRLVKGKYGTLVTDGATFRHWKVIVVLFVSTQLEEPVLVSVIVPEAGVGVGVAEGARADAEEGADDEEDYSYRAPAGALDVRAGMTRIGLLDKFITNVMGDNVAFNVRVHLARRSALRSRLRHCAALRGTHASRVD